MKINQIARIIGLTAIVGVVSCGVSKKSVEEADKKISELRLMGVPDSALSRAIVFVYQTKDAIQRGNTGLAKKSADSMNYYISRAEVMFKDDVSKLQPEIEAIKTKINSTKSRLSGLHVKKIDSLMTPVDSFISLKWILNANTLIRDIEKRLPQLEADQVKADGLKKSLPGEWVCQNITKSKENKAIYAVEKKIFIFERDGKAKLIENKKGQSGPYLKEDYEFISYGTYDLLGDTVSLFINRFVAVRQNFDKLYVENGKKVWKKEPQPTYDSAITDGSQNRFITYADLTEDFKQVSRK